MRRQVRWAHQPAIVKELIRRGGFRPMQRDCFTNCSRLAIAARGTPYESCIRYCEGWATSRFGGLELPLEHAWVQLEGRIVELTLPPDRLVQYGQHRVLSPAEVVVLCGQIGHYGPYHRLHEFHPHIAQIRALQRRISLDDTRCVAVSR